MQRLPSQEVLAFFVGCPSVAICLVVRGAFPENEAPSGYRKTYGGHYFGAILNVKGFHGIDERLGTKDLNRMIRLYEQLLQLTPP